MASSTPPMAAPTTALGARPTSVTVVSIVAMVLGVMMLVGAGLLIVAGTLQGAWGNFHSFGDLSFWLPEGAFASGLTLALVGAMHVAAGAGLVRRYQWAWWLALALVISQVVSGVVATINGQLDRASQALAYGVAGGFLVSPRVRGWFSLDL